MRTLSATTPDPTFGSGRFEAFRQRFHEPVILLVLTGALTFNLMLCFVNTVVFPVNDTLVMGCELILITIAFSMVLGTNAALYLVLGVFLSYMAMIMAMRPLIDPKAVRDFLIPIAFYALGRTYADPRIADRAALISGLIVVGFGLFEYFFLDIYLQYFNIIAYYVARGTVAANTVSEGQTLFASGIRPTARNILPFLGQHRVSSVFLEPVSAGNFGAIVYMWALFRRDMRWRWTTLATGVVAIALSDARFGLNVCFVITALWLVPWRMPRLVWFVMPFAWLLGLGIYGMMSAQVDWDDNFGGRLLWTARLLTSLDWRGVFGISPLTPFLADSGYAYMLNELGIFGVLGFWALFIYIKENNAYAWRFKMFAATYFCLNLLISNSLFSIKTAALLWFMLGTSDGFRPLLSTVARAYPSRFAGRRDNAFAAPPAAG